VPSPPPTETLGDVLKRGRAQQELSLRDVERRTGIRSGHLSQIETGVIAQPELAILWDLAGLYELDFARLLGLAGLSSAGLSSGRRRQQVTVALRALGELSAEDQAEALQFIAELKARREHG
jgi:transcriptional regulator with XRE-family HTH domain